MANEENVDINALVQSLSFAQVKEFLEATSFTVKQYESLRKVLKAKENEEKKRNYIALIKGILTIEKLQWILDANTSFDTQEGGEVDMEVEEEGANDKREGGEGEGEEQKSPNKKEPQKKKNKGFGKTIKEELQFFLNHIEIIDARADLENEGLAAATNNSTEIYTMEFEFQGNHLLFEFHEVSDQDNEKYAYWNKTRLSYHECCQLVERLGFRYLSNKIFSKVLDCCFGVFNSASDIEFHYY